MEKKKWIKLQQTANVLNAVVSNTFIRLKFCVAQLFLASFLLERRNFYYDFLRHFTVYMALTPKK